MNFDTLACVLTAKGYAVRKDRITDEQAKKIRQELTVAPKSQSRSGPQGTPFSVQYESPQRQQLPRFWAREYFGTEEADALPEGDSLPDTLQFQGKPYDQQEAIVHKFLDVGGNGLICVPCGKGKTFMAINIAARLGKRFMVIVDKEFLLQQWKGELEAFLPGLRIGILQGPRIEVEPEHQDVTLCMIQSLVQKSQPPHIFRTQGFTIFDECHHLGAAHFSRALLKVQTKQMLGLSATPTREDGLTKVFEWYLGPPVQWEKRREADPTVIVRVMQQSSEDPKQAEVPVDQKGEPVLARLLTKIVECEERTAWIVKTIKELCEEPHRRVLVLSERIKHLEVVETMLAESGLTTGQQIGGMKEAVREEAGRTARVLLASYAMASEAMNIKSLNAVILASPRKRIEQSVGRVLRERPTERKVPPVIIDVVDSHGVQQGQQRKRRVFQKACGQKLQIQQQGSEDTSTDDEELAPVQKGLEAFTLVDSEDEE